MYSIAYVEYSFALAYYNIHSSLKCLYQIREPRVEMTVASAVKQKQIKMRNLSHNNYRNMKFGMQSMTILEASVQNCL